MPLDNIDKTTMLELLNNMLKKEEAGRERMMARNAPSNMLMYATGRVSMLQDLIYEIEHIYYEPEEN